MLTNNVTAMGRHSRVLLIALLMALAGLTLLPFPSFADDTPKGITKLVADIDNRNPVPDPPGRIPLILIHGLHGTKDTNFVSNDGNTSEEKEYFKNFIEYFYNHDLQNNFKLYRLHYLSDRLSVQDIGQGLREWLDDFISQDAIQDGPFVILAHSMGGLVARSYMEEQIHQQGAYTGQLGGTRVARLISLATPHHGSPAANDSARTFLLGGQAELTAMTNLLDIFFWWKTDSNCINAITDACGSSNLLGAFINLYNISQDCQVQVDEPNRSDLRWDNYSGISAEYEKTTISPSTSITNSCLQGLLQINSMPFQTMAWCLWIAGSFLGLQFPRKFL
ncbi:MAG: hypothetical protein B1H11_05090 [Desulfobacteraceae bacterium 4484_190.1]|nr:MAG: hypothetical protein B1H11_05090 [Desulfobacteraceae bacterium 4484_190.1]